MRHRSFEGGAKMRKIIYLFIFAIVFLIVKAFVLDDYIKRYTTQETNTTADLNASAEAVQSETEPINTIEPETNNSTTAAEKNDSSKNLETPLEHLGNEISKHINL